MWKIGIISHIWSTRSEISQTENCLEEVECSQFHENRFAPISHWVDQMWLMIPIFHTESDALQLSYNKHGEIPPHGDFGGFLWLLWLFYHLDATKYLKALLFWNLHISRNISGCMAPGARSITNTVWLTRRVGSITCLQR